MAINTKRDPQSPVPVPVDLFAGGSGRATVALAGLLQAEPDLVGAQLLPAEWQAHLDAYLSSPRP